MMISRWLKPRFFFHFRNRKAEGMVSHRYPVTGNRTGYGDTTIFHADAMLIEINAHHGLKTGIIGPEYVLACEISPLAISHRARRAFVPPTSPTKAYFVILLLLR